MTLFVNISLPVMQGVGGLLLLLASLELLTGKGNDPTAAAGVNMALAVAVVVVYFSAIAVQMTSDAVRAFVKAG